MKHVDVVIIGAGPAGSVCAYLLKKAGVDCLLVDRATFPRDKLCGGGLTPMAWMLLDKLIPGIRYEYNSLHRIKLTIEGIRSCEFDTAIEMRIVRRKDFDNTLLEAYKAAGGSFLHDGFHCYEETPDGLVVTLKSGGQVACRYLVGADGSNSTVRRQLTGRRDNGILIMEQFVEKSPENAIEVTLSRQYGVSGYFYRFPNSESDAIGYGDMLSTKPDKFRNILKQKGIPETKLRGCYVYLKNDYPLNDHIILIGDAGGFASRTTSEGIKPAFISARNAAEAIVSGRPFSETNARLFKKMKRSARFADFFFNATSLWLLGQLCRWPSLIKWRFDRAVRPRKL